MRDYELVIVISPEVGEQETSETVDGISSFITERGGSVTSQEQWGVRRLAYPVQGYHEGNYFVTQFTSDPILASELDANMVSSAEVIRHLLVKQAT